MSKKYSKQAPIHWSPLAAAIAVAVGSLAQVALAADEDATQLESVTVTGSRIKKAEVEGQAPVFTLERKDIEKTGLGSVGDILQHLTASGRALNSKFNSSGNFGYPPEGGGIGAGSSQVDLRNLGSQRVLVLVDGHRWVNESSGSGVGGSVDMNTIPLSIVERIEVLEDGASAIYGSDAIAGVINVITRRKYEGAEVHGYYGEYDEGDGETTQTDVTIGGGNDKFNAVFSASYYNQQRVSAADRDISNFPVPNGSLAFGSSRNLQGRFTFCDPRITPLCTEPNSRRDLTLNTGTGTPFYDPANPTSGASTFHRFGTADRFNFAPYNLVLTPSERKSIFTSLRYNISDDTSWYVKGLYNKRESKNQAAPEPIVLGPDNGTGTLSDHIVISRLNPFNPFGIDLDPNFNFYNLGRRPVEGGPRIFVQDVDTYYFGTGLEGNFNFADRRWSWDVNFTRSESNADQNFYNGYNLRRMQIALGDPAVCAANPGCTPLNLFGGQGANGQGTITQAMLDWIRFTTKDSSEQKLTTFSGNITGDLFELPAGPLGFASGVEYRKYAGSFTPDQARIAGESQDSAAVATKGDYDVKEIYAEVNVPIVSDAAFAKKLDLSLAERYSDYNTFGSKSTGKVGLRWQIVDDFLLRGTYAQGFRAPFIGELFGSAQFGATLTDPCSGNVTPNCAALGVPAGYTQIDTQITTTTGGNPNLKPETSDSYTFGAVYSPGWATNTDWSQRFDIESTYYHDNIDKAIKAPDAQDRLNLCVASGNPNSVFCQGITRNASGNINRFNNLLANLGKIRTSGVDIKLNYVAPNTDWGQFSASLQSTHVITFEAIGTTGVRESRRPGVEENDGSIPEWQSNLQVGWHLGNWDASWSTRYISGVTEICVDTDLGPCSNPTTGFNRLGSTTYNDLQVGWNNPFELNGLRVDVGVNNIFDRDPPKCGSCTLNGYDASTYEVPGQFWYVEATYKF